MKLNLEELVRKGGKKSPPSVLLVVVWMIALVWYFLSGFTIFGWKVPPIEPISTLSALTLVAAYYVGKYNFYDPMRKKSEEEASRPAPEAPVADKTAPVKATREMSAPEKASPGKRTSAEASPATPAPAGISPGRPVPGEASPDKPVPGGTSPAAPVPEATPDPGAPNTTENIGDGEK